MFLSFIPSNTIESLHLHMRIDLIASMFPKNGRQLKEVIKSH